MWPSVPSKYHIFLSSMNQWLFIGVQYFCVKNVSSQRKVMLQYQHCVPKTDRAHYIILVKCICRHYM